MSATDEPDLTPSDPQGDQGARDAPLDGGEPLTGCQAARRAEIVAGAREATRRALLGRR